MPVAGQFGVVLGQLRIQLGLAGSGAFGQRAGVVGGLPVAAGVVSGQIAPFGLQLVQRGGGGVVAGACVARIVPAIMGGGSGKLYERVRSKNRASACRKEAE